MATRKKCIDIQNNEWTLTRDLIGEFIQSKLLLEEGFKHAFFTRNCNDNGPENLPKSSIHKTNQVHGDKILKAKDAVKSPKKNADGLISDKKEQSLWIYSADCIPVLIADRKEGTVASCHAGWRGVVSSIIAKTIGKMITNGSNINDLLIVLGPAISGENFEIESNILRKNQ